MSKLSNYPRYGRRSSSDTGLKVLIAIVVAVVVSLIVWTTVQYNQEDVHAGCKVDDKDRTTTYNNGNRETEARIYTENCGVFVVGDSLVKGTFSSADTYNSIKRGKTYDFTTVGWRVPFFSMFPNIIKAVPSE